ncbi:hypothetical protein [Thioclava sp. JE_KL1]|uniref:hypothetical protein n=1 Tax=Thioclava sp. JE_KL1 TaxID=2651187 RepID=UPI00128CEDE7|nr:hypothetical protein [Thioclava sp. JE_KL1]MPQ95825.1 hypothetical protein [Thioclava sp. JE_KL1]
MTEIMIDLPGLIVGSDDTSFLRALIHGAAQRLMGIELVVVLRGGVRSGLAPCGPLISQLRDLRTVRRAIVADPPFGRTFQSFRRENTNRIAQT